MVFSAADHEPNHDGYPNGRAIPMRSLEESLPMALLKAREAAMRWFRPQLSAYGLTEQQWRVLRVLSAVEGKPIEVGALAEETFLHGPSLSRILSNLQGRGYLDRRPADYDHRRSLISLTASGYELVVEVAPSSEGIYNMIEDGFGTERLKVLLGELQSLAELKASPPTSGAQNLRDGTMPEKS